MLMSYWDSSALVKLYVQEMDSAEFRALAVEASRAVTGSLTRHKVSVAESGRRFPNGEVAGALRRVPEEILRKIAAADAVPCRVSWLRPIGTAANKDIP
jgi:hypothetical protein